MKMIIINDFIINLKICQYNFSQNMVNRLRLNSFNIYNLNLFILFPDKLPPSPIQKKSIYIDN